MTENKKEKHINTFIVVCIILLLICFIYPIFIFYFFNDWGKAGQFGDTFGTLNAVFSALAFAGIIITIIIQKQELKNQFEELKLQREEMKNTRIEFLNSRITNLVYNQLDRFETYLNDFEIIFGNEKHKGNNAIFFLDESLERGYITIGTSEEENFKIQKKALEDNLKILLPNVMQIHKLSTKTYNSIMVLKQLIYSSELEPVELNNLKNIFFNNIGMTTLDVLNKIKYIETEQYKYLDRDEYKKYNPKFNNFAVPYLYLHTIDTFNQQKITKDNFNDLRLEWLDYISGGKKNKFSHE